MTTGLSNLTEELLHHAGKAGADAAEAVAVSSEMLAIDVREGALEQAERSEGTDIGLRVFVGKQQANVSASDTSAETMRELAARAVAMAREAPEDPHAGLADPAELAGEVDWTLLDLTDQAPAPSPDALRDMALRAETAARQIAGVSKVQGASASTGFSRSHIMATNGFSSGSARSEIGLSCTAIAGTGLGMERDYDGDMRIHAADLRAPEEIGALAGTRAVARLGSRKPPTGGCPVLFDERVSSSLIGHLLAAVNGAQIVRGASWLRDALGAAVLPENLSLLEEPHRPRCFSSRLVDAEGLPTKNRAIIDAGRLTGWTLDLGSARRLGMAPTGNAARGVSSPPSPSNWNIRLTQGDSSRDDLLAAMGTGLWVTSLIGSTINPNTGDYSRGAAGYWIENGVIAYPVNECTIAGNLRDMLMRITPANDARQHLSRVVPSLLVEGMTVAGS